jgi:2-haloalkanoic acid dehalogenase type II
MTESAQLRERSAQRCDAVLAAQGLVGRVIELPHSTRTAAEAAESVGCELRQIVKSLVFRRGDSGDPVLILVSGANRVDEKWMAKYAGDHLARADPEFVRSCTGFAIGGVPPVGHPTPIPTFIDYDLLERREVWAAAGHPRAVCRLSSEELLHLTQGRPVPVVRDARSESRSAPWVTFDCYGTLVDWRSGLLQQLAVLSDGAPPNSDRWFSAYVREERALEAGPYFPYRALMPEALRRAARSEGLSFPSARAGRAPESIPGWPVFPDTQPALTALHELGFQIGVLSNIDGDLLQRTMRAIGVTPDCIVTAEDVGSYKPAFSHWINFLKRTGADPVEVWHVSASYEHDIEPARRLGFRTAYVERYGGAPEGKEVGLSARNLHNLVDRFRPRPHPGRTEVPDLSWRQRGTVATHTPRGGAV